MTQVLRLLRLPQEVQQAILALGDPIEGKQIGVHTLRDLSRVSTPEQERRVAELVQGRPAAGD